MITVSGVPAFTDNYLWLIEHDGRAAVVDPGDGAAILAALEARGLALCAILITHHHPDHIGGIARLKQAFDVPVYGPRAEAAKIPALEILLDDGDAVDLTALAARFTVLAVPGHTLGHIAYYRAAQDGSPPLLFCGDTLFSAGCGRLFEGTPAQMHASLARLAGLPGETVVYCAHEYTLSNLDFATAVEPANAALAAEFARVKALRAAGIPSIPTTISREQAINPFLRAADPAVIEAVARHGERPAEGPVEVFAALRRWKDGYRTRPL